MNAISKTRYLPALPESLVVKLREALVTTDRIAYSNVTHDDSGTSILNGRGNPIRRKFSRGGPFGAMLAISLEDGTFESVGEARGNNVIGSGIASRHAEDQALQPDNYRFLKTRLTELKTSGHNPMVWMVSSGQSCTNCHVKQEIMARDLAAQGLLDPGRFVTLYGATYDDTFNIAQFYDAQYADAMIFADNNPQDKDNLIHQESVDFNSTPSDIHEILMTATSATAVVMRKGEVYAVGREGRSEFDLYATAEVNAVRAACLRSRKEGAFDSWTVDGELYTTNSEVGPLLFAEIGWTNIRNIKLIQMPVRLAAQQFLTFETPGLNNDDFMHVVAGGYRHALAYVRVVRDEDFQNTAQPKWAQVLKANKTQLYNGAAVSSVVQGTRKITRQRFAAFDVGNFIDAATCTCNQAHPKRRLQLLKRLDRKPAGAV